MGVSLYSKNSYTQLGRTMIFQAVCRERRLDPAATALELWEMNCQSMRDRYGAAGVESEIVGEGMSAEVDSAFLAVVEGPHELEASARLWKLLRWIRYQCAGAKEKEDATRHLNWLIDCVGTRMANQLIRLHNPDAEIRD